MDRTLREHISFLESRVHQFNRELMENHHNLRERNRIESEIRAAETALEFYRAAREIENRLTNTSENG